MGGDITLSPGFAVCAWRHFPSALERSCLVSMISWNALEIFLIPLGGYVKMFGDVDPASTQGSDTYIDDKTGKPKKMTKNSEQAFFTPTV